MRNAKRGTCLIALECVRKTLINIQVYFDYTNPVRAPTVTVLLRSRISSNYLEDRNT